MYCSIHRARNGGAGSSHGRGIRPGTRNPEPWRGFRGKKASGSREGYVRSWKSGPDDQTPDRRVNGPR